MFENFKKGELNFLDIFFEDKYALFNNYKNDDFIIKNYHNSSKDYLNNMSNYLHFIDYSTGKTFVANN